MLEFPEDVLDLVLVFSIPLAHAPRPADVEESPTPDLCRSSAVKSMTVAIIRSTSSRCLVEGAEK